MFLTHLTRLTKVLDKLGEGFDATQSISSLSPLSIIIALSTATICGVIIYLVYRFFYRGIVYSENFNILILLVTVVTGFIIMTISANLVLSLGMVGALSIVRFRAAIKDPLDIGFLFWGVAAGITAGAGLYPVALIGTVVIAIIYISCTFMQKERKSYLLIIRYSENSEEQISTLLQTLKYKLKNKTASNTEVELTVEIRLKNNDTSNLTKFKAVEGVNSVTLLEYSGEYMS